MKASREHWLDPKTEVSAPDFKSTEGACQESLGRSPSRLLKNAVHFGYKLRGVRKERARQTGRVLDRDPSAAQIERRPILPAGERSSGHNWFWGRSAPAVPASL